MAKTLTDKPLVVVCSWCPDAKQRTREAQATGAVVTHGICNDCQQKLEAIR